MKYNLLWLLAMHVAINALPTEEEALRIIDSIDTRVDRNYPSQVVDRNDYQPLLAMLSRRHNKAEYFGGEYQLQILRYLIQKRLA